MAKQAELFRDRGIAIVEDNSAPWQERARQGLSGLSGRTLTGEGIRLELSKTVGVPHHPNAWGALINYAVRHKMIFPTGRYLKMQTPKSHARKTPEYTVR